MGLCCSKDETENTRARHDLPSRNIHKKRNDTTTRARYLPSRKIHEKRNDTTTTTTANTNIISNQPEVARIHNIWKTEFSAEECKLESIVRLTINKLLQINNKEFKSNENIAVLIDKLKNLTTNLPEVSYAKGEESSLGWVYLNNLNQIFLNEIYAERFRSDPNFLQSTLIHEAIHSIGYFHGRKHQDIAYVVQFIMFPESLVHDAEYHATYLQLALELLRNNPDSEDYIKSFILFYKELRLSFSDTELDESKRKKNVSNYSVYSNGTLEFIQKHLLAILDNDEKKVASYLEKYMFRTHQIEGNVHGLKDSRTEKKAVKKLSKEGNIHGF